MAYDNEGNYFDESGMGPNPEFMVMPTAMPMSRMEEPVSSPPPPPYNPDFAVMPVQRPSDTAEDYAAWRALYPDARSWFWDDKASSPPPPSPPLDPNYNPYETQLQPYPYDTQPKPYDPYNLDRNDKPTVYPYEAVRDGGVMYPYDPSTNTYPTAPPGYNPYDTQPKPYNPYETLPLPDNPQPYNPYDTPDKFPMDIGQLLARLGYGNSSKPTPTMTPMASGTAVAAPGIGSDLASLLRRYYGK